MTTTTFNPFIFEEVDLHRGVAGTSEEEVLNIHILSKFGTVKIKFDVISSVSVVNDHLRKVIRSDIIVLAIRPLEVPPAGDNTNLEPVASCELNVELLGLHPLPSLSRNLCDTFLTVRIGVGSFEAETIYTIPVHYTKSFWIRILPDDFFYSLPVTTGSTWLIGQFRHRDFLSVVGMKRTCEVALIDVLLWNKNLDLAGAFTIEVLVVNQLRNTVCIKQFNTVDKFQIRTEYSD